MTGLLTNPRARWALAALTVALLGGLIAIVASAQPAAASSSVPYNLNGQWSNRNDSLVYAITMTANGAYTGTATNKNGTTFTVSGQETGCSATVVETGGESLSGSFVLSVLPDGNLAGIGSYTDSGSSTTGNIDIEQTGLDPGESAPVAASGCASAQGGTATSGTEVSCNELNAGQANAVDQCTATVGGGTTTPTGTVQFVVGGGAAGGLSPSGASGDGDTSLDCTLAASQTGGNTSFCAVDYSPPVSAGGQPPITATYLGDSTYGPSSGAPGDLGTGSDTGTDTTSTSTTTTATTDTTTTTDDCGASIASIRRGENTTAVPAPCTAPEQIAAFQAEMQSLGVTVTAMQVEQAQANYAAYNGGSTNGITLGALIGTVVAVESGQTQPSPTGSYSVLQASSLIYGLIQQITSQKQQTAAKAFNALDGFIRDVVRLNARPAKPSATLGEVVKPGAIKLALPAGKAAADVEVARLLIAEAALKSEEGAAATSLARADSAGADHLSADFKLQFSALMKDDDATATALSTLNSDYQKLLGLLGTALKHHGPTTAQLKQTLSALAHPSKALVTDARRLGGTSLLTTLERTAKAGKGNHATAAATLKWLRQGESVNAKTTKTLVAEIKAVVAIDAKALTLL